MANYLFFLVKFMYVEVVEQLKLSLIFGGNTKWYNHFRKSSGRCFLNIKLTTRPYSSNSIAREMKTCVHQKTKGRMFITALFIKAPNWKQPVSINKRMKKQAGKFIQWNAALQQWITNCYWYLQHHEWISI